jgi:filamentous hemagglutinin family protein
MNAKQNPRRKGAARPTCALRAITVAVTSLFATSVHALPTGPQVVAGSATIQQSGNVLTIANTPGAIIHWDAFSIGAGEAVRFQQQNSLSAVLNRVTGREASQILGELTSNGRVWLINPNGILFSPGSRVDVQGLIASTLNASDADFLAGRMNFSGESTAPLKNAGLLQAAERIYLVGTDIENSGIIRAGGEVLLAAGRQVTLVDAAHPEIQVVVSAPSDKAVNLGEIIAGKIGLFGALVQQKGVARADTAAVDEQGRIVFRASRRLDVEAGSTTSANGVTGGTVTLQTTAGDTYVRGTVTARGEAGAGGTVQVLGERVAVMDGAVIDASGATGGRVLVGGDYQGKNPDVQRSTVTYFGPDATIRANAEKIGDGGTVIVWADDSTRAFGRIEAKGGPAGGDGGLIETSGKRYLDANGIATDTSAPRGKAGTWLLDPSDITIAASGENLQGGSFSGGIFSGANGSPTLTWDTINNQSGNVKIQTSQGSGGSGNITIANSGTFIGTGFEPSTLSLLAEGNITFNDNISVSCGNCNLHLVAGWTGTGENGNNTGTGNITFNTGSSLTTTKRDGLITLKAGGNLILNNAAITAGSRIGLAANDLKINGAVTAINGDITLLTNRLIFGESGSLVANHVANGGVLIAPQTSGKSIKVTNDSQSPCDNLCLFPSDLASISTPRISTPKLVLGYDNRGGVTPPFGGTIPVTQSVYIEAPLNRSGGTLFLMGSENISQTNGGMIAADKLGARGSNIVLHADNNKVGTFAAQAIHSVAFKNNSSLTVGAVTGILDGPAVSGITATGESFARINVWSQKGSLVVSSPIQSVGSVYLDSSNDLTVNAPVAGKEITALANGGNLFGTSLLDAGRGAIYLSATRGAIGSTDSPIYTRAATLTAKANSDIVVVNNMGSTQVTEFYNCPSSSNWCDGIHSFEGNINLTNYGTTTVSSGSNHYGNVSAAGTVSITAIGPLTVGPGGISAGGNVTLKADNSGSNITLLGNIRTSGAIALNVSGGSVFGASAYAPGAIINLAGSAPRRNSLPPPPSDSPSNPPEVSEPTLDQCVADPSLSGCSSILPLARCAANRDLAGCSAVSVVLEICTTFRSIPGCDELLAILASCAANPTQVDCIGTLPTLSACATTPSTPGCAVVLPNLASCTANPAQPGCSAVLPTLSTCATTPSTPGCAVVLPSLSSCIANPAQPGCSAVLPSLELPPSQKVACLVNPGTCSSTSLPPPNPTVQTTEQQIVLTLNSAPLVSDPAAEIANGGASGFAGSGGGGDAPGRAADQPEKDEEKAGQQVAPLAPQQGARDDSRQPNYCN